MKKYKECLGCYSYSESQKHNCLHIEEMYKVCPCKKCLIKPVCNSVCPDYINANILTAKLIEQSKDQWTTQPFGIRK